MAKHELVGDVRGGRGLMAALELVSDRSTKASIDKQTPVVIQDAIYDAGVMVRVSGPNMILSPPLTVTEQDVVEMINAIDTGLSAASK